MFSNFATTKSSRSGRLGQAGNPKRRLRLTLLALVLTSLFVMVLDAASPAQALSFSSPFFRRNWQRADYPVAIAAVQRGFTWGVAPFFSSFEPYTDSPNGQRRVEYFDKARMEISQPDNNTNSDYFVTNGLIVKEMVTGLVQVGDNTFAQRFPAYDVPVAGDPAGNNPDAVTYGSFYALNSFYNTGPAGPNDNNANYPGPSTLERQPDRTNERVFDTIVKGGSLGRNDLLGSLDGLNYVYYDSALGHNVPKVFYDFLNQTGSIYDGANLVNGKVFNWVSTMGYPITDAYWTKAVVAGVTRDVLVQLYERRILTYTPTNPDPYKVEMGNVGRHYYSWRYSPQYDLNIPLQVNAEVKPQAGFPGTTFSIRAFRFVQLEPVDVTLISPDGLPAQGVTFPDPASGGVYGNITGKTFFDYYVRTNARTKPGQYIVYFKGQRSQNEAKAYFFVLGVPGFNLPPQ